MSRVVDSVMKYGAIGLGVFMAFFAAWLTHIIHCLQHDQWGFLIAGALCFPIGIIHGIGLWFGLF